MEAPPNYKPLRAHIVADFMANPSIPSLQSRKAWAGNHGVPRSLMDSWYRQLKLGRVLPPGQSKHPKDGERTLDPYSPQFGLLVTPPLDYVVAGTVATPPLSSSGPGPSSSAVSTNPDFSSSPASTHSLLQTPFSFDFSSPMGAMTHDEFQQVGSTVPLFGPLPAAPPASANVESRSKKDRSAGRYGSPAPPSNHRMETRAKRKLVASPPSAKRVKTSSSTTNSGYKASIVPHAPSVQGQPDHPSIDPGSARHLSDYAPSATYALDAGSYSLGIPDANTAYPTFGFDFAGPWYNEQPGNHSNNDQGLGFSPFDYPSLQ